MCAIGNTVDGLDMVAGASPCGFRTARSVRRFFHSGGPSRLTRQQFQRFLFFPNARLFPTQLKASLAEQLSVEQLREEFRRYAKTQVAQELVDFYVESLDREEVKGYFERQVTF